MVKVVYISLMAACIAGAIYLPVLGAPISQPFEQQDAARTDASLRQRADAPMVRTAFLRLNGDDYVRYKNLASDPMKALPKDDISFPVERIIVTSNERVLRKYKNQLEIYNHSNIGANGIAVLQNQLQEQLLVDGYVTSQVVVPNQDLHSGILIFEIMPGYVEDIVLTNPHVRTNWRSAFPIKKGTVFCR
ncbi:POTRA domain-containing protein [Veillonella caviae]|uniref:POTRA domain-containing protein n=1 Tax=Veillonella caviae TaxID=248316 RepID=UPI0023F45806|nr:POTRA domain-containing protein [Veillonella caviae]MCI6407391.1 hypothetical protein [Veillonella caviae]MDY6225713.1 POTRA domain-containing protein [Veillonella caviae]